MWLPSDPWLRAVVSVAVAAGAIVGYHRILAHRAGGAVSRQGEPWRLFLPIRLGGAAMLAALIATVAAPDRVSWASLPLADSVRWFGGIVGLLGIGLLAWALHSLGPNLTDTVTTRERHRLVTGGPYRWIRHPFYVAMLLIVLSCSLLSANWLIALPGVLVFWLLVIRSQIEEERLIARFGDEYRRYAARTGRCLPRWRRPGSNDADQ